MIAAWIVRGHRGLSGRGVLFVPRAQGYALGSWIQARWAWHGSAFGTDKDKVGYVRSFEQSVKAQSA